MSDGLPTFDDIAQDLMEQAADYATTDPAGFAYDVGRIDGQQGTPSDVPPVVEDYDYDYQSGHDVGDAAAVAAAAAEPYAGPAIESLDPETAKEAWEAEEARREQIRSNIEFMTEGPEEHPVEENLRTMPVEPIQGI